MGEPGMLVTIATSWLGAIAFIAAGAIVCAHFRRDGRRSTIGLFFYISGAYLSFAGTRILFGYLGAHEIDALLFYGAGVCAYLSIVPMAHLTFKLVTGQTRLARLGAATFVGVALAGILPMIRSGIDGPWVSYWSTEYSLRAPLSKLVLLFGVLLPALVCSLVILFAALRVDRPHRSRLLAVGATTFVFFLMLTSDGLAWSEGFLVAERLGMTVAALVVLYMYQTNDAPGRVTTRTPLEVASAEETT